MPDFSLENEINGNVCGIDEVGRGPLAGPVVAACVYIPQELHALEWITEIRDSKKLSDKQLESLYALIRGYCFWGIAECSPTEIDDLNILQASLKAMGNAFLAMNRNSVTHALVDGRFVPKLPCSATPVVKGDSISTSIAAASILAKVTRDRLMRNLAKQYPYYGWERNVGYPTKEHMDAINTYGVTQHHRKSFRPVREYIEATQTRTQTRLQA